MWAYKVNAVNFLQTAKEFGYLPTSVKIVQLTLDMKAVGITYLEGEKFGYLEFNHDGRYGLMLSKVQTIQEAEQDEDFYFKSFESTYENYRKSIMKIYEHLNA